MSSRELVVLGTASAVPTRYRNHNGYLLRWDGEGVLLDPGEGTQRQMSRAGLSAHDITRICLTHFHGDHCLGVPGVVQRIAREGVTHPVHAAFPASGEPFWRRLRHASVFLDTDVVVEHPLAGEAVGRVGPGGSLTLSARRLSHPVEAYGYRLTEPDGVRMLPEALAAAGVRGPDVGRLQREGVLTTPQGRTVTLAECSVARPGQKVAFVMDTRLCPAVEELADAVDLLVIEATFLTADAHLAEEYGHLTVAQAARVAAGCGVRRLVLTHFSERYGEAGAELVRAEAEAVFDGELVVAEDLGRVPVPPRR